MPVSGPRWGEVRDLGGLVVGGNRNAERVGSGKGMLAGRAVSGREGREMPRVSASMRSSRAVITQSVSRTGGLVLDEGLGDQ